MNTITIMGAGEAKAQVTAFIQSLRLRPMDVGGLHMATTLEQACMLVLGLTTNSIQHTNFSIGVSFIGINENSHEEQ